MVAFTSSEEYATSSYSLVQGAKLLLWGPDLQTLDQAALGFGASLSIEEEALASSLVRLYTGLLGREPDEAGFDYWLEALASGNTLVSTANDFAVSNEFLSEQSELGSERLIESLYNQVLGRAPDTDGAAYWNALLKEPSFDEGDLVLAFTDSAENIVSTQVTVDSYLQRHYEPVLIGVPEDIDTYLLG